MKPIILIYLFSLFFLACDNSSDKYQVQFQRTGLVVASTRAIKSLDNEIHGVHYIDNNGKYIEKDSVNILLYSISQLDDFTETNSNKYIKGESEIYEKKNLDDKVYKLIITNSLLDNHWYLPFEEPVKNRIFLQDFDILLNDSIKHITIRVLNDYEVIKIKMDTTEIYRISENAPIVLDKAIHKIDSLRKWNGLY